MKKKNIFRFFVLSAALILLITTMSCDNNNNNPEVSSVSEQTDAPAGDVTTDAPGSTAEVTTEEPVVTTEPIIPVEHTKIYDVNHRNLYITTLDWTGSTEAVVNGEDVGLAYWKVSSLKKLRSNLVSVFCYWKDPVTGSSNGPGMILDFQNIADYTKAGLEATHALGAEVVPSVPMVLINMGAAASMNWDWHPYATMNSKGQYVVDSKYAYGCINNPLFQGLIRNATVTACKNGFDGMFYDGSPYSYGPAYNCCCDYCKATWKEYSLKYLGKETPIPTAAPNHQTEESRLLWKMRCDIFINFVMDVEKECRQINPKFNAWPNLGCNGTVEPYYTLHGLTHTITEFGGTSTLDIGRESSLYLYRQYEAENPNNMLVSQFNDINAQATPYWRWETAFVEAIAGGGSLMLPSSSTGTSLLFDIIDGANNIIHADEAMMTDSISIADTAVVYSWQELNAYHLRKTGLMDLSINAPRKAASALASKGIPFDYVVVENTTKLEQLTRYKTLVFNDFRLISPEFNTLLDEYIKQGGQVLIIGYTFADNVIVTEGLKYEANSEDLIMKWFGQASIDIIDNCVVKEYGKGKVCLVHSGIAGTNSATFAIKPALTKAFEELNLYNQVKVTEKITGNVETTLRSNETGSRWWLHAVTYGSEGVYGKEKITIQVTVPEGERVCGVTAQSPRLNAKKIDLSWSQEGNVLTINAQIGVWTVFTIDK